MQKKDRHGARAARGCGLCAALALLAALAACAPEGQIAQSAVSAASAAPAASAAASEPAAPQEASSVPEPVETPESRIAAVLETLEDRCTGAAPQIKDPATWNDAGKALYERLMSDAYLVDTCGLRMDEKAGCPYLLAVNRAANTVTVLTADEAGNYTVPYMAFVCSTGESTPPGFYETYADYAWKELFGPCYGQYAVRFWGSYLFHSVPYYTRHQNNLEYDEYNLLGTMASMGCVRLSVVDEKWIYDNCPLGTRVVVYNDAEDPGPMGKPGTIAIDPEDALLRGWDPTDPDERNPWAESFLPGTAIRSDAAWVDYRAAAQDGTWSDTVNATALWG